ncbi:hypothetical protein RvY_18324-3 [Ramazzottius varieornatus]|uniref:Receptor ligand binding region domain-containing protein n=1 Tax=Ramazzottius varieornatus TaxID=947166 RepID=A0A1D1WAA5_RAMVA|nr:hypothetical protein RvY_18324-3 [Ramazzottius varieornatus]
MTQGEHVHLCFRVTRNPLLGNFHWRYGDKYDEVAKEAYRTVLIAESDPDLDVPPAGSEARRLREQWRQASLERYNFSYAASEPVVAEMVGANLTELLQDGRHIARRFYNRTFRLRTGNVSFDQYGSSAGVDGIVEQYDEAGNLTKVVHCAVGTVVPLAPVRIIEIKAVTWVGGVWPPPNRPPCGFDGMDPDCQPKRNQNMEVSIAVTLAILCAVLLLAVAKVQHSVRISRERWWWEVHERELSRMGAAWRRMTLYDLLSRTSLHAIPRKSSAHGWKPDDYLLLRQDLEEITSRSRRH